MADHDDLISNFVGITDSTPHKAEAYLKVTDWSLEQAIQLFFDTGGADLDGGPAPAASSSDDPIVIPDDDMESSDIREATRASGGYDNDEEMARKLQEEFYGQQQQDEVRAPLPRTRETLVGGYMDEDGDDDALYEPPRPIRRPVGRPGIFNQNTVWDDPDEPGLTPQERHRRRLAAATGGESERSSRDRTLADLFSPPFDLISNLSWEDARDEAKDDMKWILVNVQDMSIFQSQQLNRDVWKNKEVQETVRENFIFLQYNRAGNDARDYIRLYIPQAAGPEARYNGSDDLFPHVAIIDPRTGEQVKVWAKPPLNPIEFVHSLHEFLDRYSLSDDAKNPVQRKTQPKINIDSMTEEEMMRLAMEESLGGAFPRSATAHDPDAFTKEDDAGNLMDFEEETPVEPAKEQSAFDKIPSDRHHVEPPPGPPSTRIQFKLSDGSRVVRRFLPTDPVEKLFEYVKADLLPEVAAKSGDESIAKKEFELVSLGKKLIEYLGQTIEEANLKMGTIMVETVEN